MASMRSNLSMFSNFLFKTTNFATCGFQQVRNKACNRWMIRDMKRRKIAEEYASERLRMVAMKRNNILPLELRKHVSKEFDEKIPRQSAMKQLTRRCALTSRGRGVVDRWRLSRIMFRDLADYNKLSGVQRAMW